MSAMDAARTGILVGREHQLASAVRFSDKLELDGSSGILRIWAAPGMGKTRLVQEMEDRLPGRRFLFFRGEPSNGHSVFGSFLKDWFGLSPGMDAQLNRDAFSTVWEALRMSPHPVSREMEIFRPFIENLAGLSADGKVARMEPAQRWERTASALAFFIDVLSEGSPAAIVMEDLHWFSEDELTVASRIIEAGTAGSRIFILTGRPDPDGKPPDIKGEFPLLDSLELTLEGLPFVKMREFLRSAGIRGADAELIDYVWKTAGGTPLFLRLTADYLRNSGALVIREDGVSLEFADRGLPSSVREIFSTRLDLLPGESRRVVNAAAVLGAGFSLPLLESMLSDDVWESGTRDGLLDGIISMEGDHGSFHHDLLREWTAELIPADILPALHLLAAESMRDHPELGGSASRVERMANHYLLGGEAEKGTRLLEKAAQGYAMEFRNSAAARIYRKLIPLMDDPARISMELDLYDVYKNGGLLRECIELLTGTLGRMEAEPSPDGIDLRPLVELKLGESLGSSGDLGRAEELVSSALEEFSAAGDLENLAKAERQLGMILMSAGRTDEALETTERSVELARETGSPRLLCAALYWAAIAYRQVGDHEKMEACTLEQVELAGKEGLDRSIVAGYDNLMRIYIYRRDYDSAEEVHERLRVAAEEMGNWAALNTATSKMGIIHLRRGDTEKAADCFRRCVGLSEKTGNLRARCAALGNLAHSYIEKRDTASAMKYATELIDSAGRIGFRSGLMAGYARMGYIFTMMGDNHSALECLQTQIEHAQALKDSRNLSDGWATIAEIQFRLGETDGAISSIEKALQHSEAAGDMLLRGSQLVQRGRYLFFSGDEDEAAVSLKEALEQNTGRKGREHVVFRCGMYLDAMAGKEVLHMLNRDLEPEVEAEVHFCQWKVTGEEDSAKRARAVLERAGLPETHPMFRILPV